MCAFICSVPEKYLAGRQIQIEYLKMRMPALSKITWQDHRPFHLYNYHRNKSPYNLPYRIFDKMQRTFASKNYIQRNWELQFLGRSNDEKLQEWLFKNKAFQEFVPKEIVTFFYDQFKNKDAVFYSHSVSMLLTLSLFSKTKD
jgi:hypothetical protein